MLDGHKCMWLHVKARYMHNPSAALMWPAQDIILHVTSPYQVAAAVTDAPCWDAQTFGHLSLLHILQDGCVVYDCRLYFIHKDDEQSRRGSWL